MEAAVPATAPRSAPPRGRYSFVGKILLAVLLVTLADWVFFFEPAGSTLGVYAALLLTASLIASPAILRNRAALAAAAAAVFFAAALFDDPSLLAATLFWSAAAMAALLPRAPFDDGWRWFLRIAYHATASVVGPLGDLVKLRRARRRRGRGSIGERLPALWLPVLGSLLFATLFARANPIIADAFGRLDLFLLFGSLSAGRIGFWIGLGIIVWSLLRISPLALSARAAGDPDLPLPGVSPASVGLSLLAFNAIFAVQNGLDLAFLWSGAPLPEGMTLAEYAHRGAYPLIATALLAGLFVLLTLRPGSQLAGSRNLRVLVYLWIGQNVLLVASTILRTLDYVEAYSLTRLRIAALLWMTLVALGLLLICYRIWRQKSGGWLINANLGAALVVLAGCTIADLGAAAASWNVRHARDVGGRGAALDICYLTQLGPSALLPLIELESRQIRPQLREQVAWARNLAMDRLETDQGRWRGWTWRGHRRLAEARSRIAEGRLPREAAERRPCEGRIASTLTAPPAR
jgi:hypothetical protein